MYIPLVRIDLSVMKIDFKYTFYRQIKRSFFSKLIVNGILQIVKYCQKCQSTFVNLENTLKIGLIFFSPKLNLLQFEGFYKTFFVELNIYDKLAYRLLSERLQITY